MLVGHPLLQVLVGPPFPERGLGCVSPAATQWRQKTNSGRLRAVRVFLLRENFSFSYRSPRPRGPAKLQGALSNGGMRVFHGLDHTTGGSPSTTREGDRQYINSGRGPTATIGDRRRQPTREGAHILAEFPVGPYAAVIFCYVPPLPEIQGSTRALVLQRDGRTARRPGCR